MKHCIGLALALLLCGVEGGPVIREEWPILVSSGIVTLDNRTNCEEGDPQPPARMNTTQRVTLLRAQMLDFVLDAYIIPSEDAHQSEYVADADKRRGFISGFSGSAGRAVVTTDQQALWTDGRYFLQADDQLDCNWLLMKSGNPGVPSMTQWLLESLPEGSRVGADPTLFRFSEWLDLENSLRSKNIEMVSVVPNLVDAIWNDRPPYVQSPAFPLELQFTGKSWEDKVADVRNVMTSEGSDVLVLTALDETAWTLNLRGEDIPYNPVFFSYVLIRNSEIELYVAPEKITPEVEEHIQGVTIKEYGTIFQSLESLEDDPEVESIKIGGASYAIYNAIPSSKRTHGTSPILKMKAQKNDVEKQGMRNAHIKDAVALCDFLAFMESEMEAGNYWDEVTASDKLEIFRSEQQDFMGLSFTTISGFGSNGAIIHYEPTPETNRQINKTSLYLLDSGGHYKDGTTDVTRTMHYGDPSPQHIEAYTRVLQGTLDFSNVIFPYGKNQASIEILARKSLYSAGLDYKHGTSHGVGMFLFVHEDSPSSYELGWFGSDEPGYYEDGDFGVRIENVITLVEKDTSYSFYNPAYGFDVVTLVPYEPKLIDGSILSREECESVNEYHSMVFEVVGEEMMNQGRHTGYEWLTAKTQPIDCTTT